MGDTDIRKLQHVVNTQLQAILKEEEEEKEELQYASCWK